MDNWKGLAGWCLLLRDTPYSDACELFAERMVVSLYSKSF